MPAERSRSERRPSSGSGRGPRHLCGSASGRRHLCASEEVGNEMGRGGQ